ncbi:AMP-dependent synthetase [Micromonospora sp. CPCC 205371]|nr:AMP-dependent synthetase [Micromonospora sp. CPCC 205371]
MENAAPALLTGTAVGAVDAPLLTYCDDATGERVELSATALAGWAARSARMLHEGCGLGTGSRAAVLLPPHWQTAAVLLGAWSAGVSVSFRLWATAGLPVSGPGTDEPIDVSFVAPDRVDSWLDDVPDAPHRFVAGLAADREPPAGYRNFLADVGRYPEAPAGYAPIGHGDAATVDGTSYREWGRVAQELAEIYNLRAGDRLLVDAAEHEHPVKWLLAPLAAGASVVVCAHLDPATVAARAEAEHATRIL